MKCYIHYINGHEGSTRQANEALSSFLYHGWDAHLVEGITPDTLDESEFDYPLIEGGRLHDMKRKGEDKYYIKKSCVSNHIRLWRRCVEEDEPMAFIEHDAICISNFQYDVDELLCLNIEYAFSPPSVLANYPRLQGYTPCGTISPTPLTNDYPLLYYKDNIYNGSRMMPGTASYIVSPKGANRLLKCAEEYGLDQSDFFINSHNVKIDYVTPSPVKFNTTNLNTSHGF